MILKDATLFDEKFSILNKESLKTKSENNVLHVQNKSDFSSTIVIYCYPECYVM